MSASSGGWLSGLTNWLGELVKNVFESFMDFMEDLVLFAFVMGFNMWATIFEYLPVPDVLQNLNICGILMQAGPTAGWIVGVMQIPAGFTMIAGAIVFRLLRVLLTLAQWS